MSEIVVAAVAIAGLIALAVAVRGSLRRDAQFKRRYAEASTEEKVKLEPLRPRTSWVWLTYHSTSQRWIAAAVIVIMVSWVAAAIIKWSGY
jgi:hypothetical protein